jgi:hypothetical protein
MINEGRVSDRLTTVFIASGLEEQRATNIAFHLTDWTSDIIELTRIWQDIEQISDAELEGFVYKFLAHVPNHVAAAKKLIGLGPIEDVFNVGVLEEDEA